MQCKKLMLLLLILTFLVSEAYATVSVPSTCHFGLPTYDGYINFDSDQAFSDVDRISDYWYFDDYRFQVQNGNLTVTKLFINEKLVFNVSSSSAIVKAYIPSSFRDDGNPATVEGSSEWSYDESTRILTFVSPDPEVTVNWKARSGEPLPVYPYEQPSPLPLIKLPDPFVLLAKQGLTGLMVALGVVAVGGILASTVSTVHKKKLHRNPTGSVKSKTAKLKGVSKTAKKSPRGITGVKARRKKR